MSARITNLAPVGSLIKQPREKRSKGRARPDVPLADLCAARVDGVCTGRAECRHHKLRRSQGGSDHQTNTVDICDRCHEHIHANPEWSYVHGWLLRRPA